MGMNPRLLRPTATGFDPRRIAGLVAWWDAQVASSYDIATGVSEWRDLSGNGHTLTQSIGNNQPALSSMNGRTALLFDGSNDELVAASVVLNVTSADSFSFLGVTQQANSDSGYIVGNASASLTGMAVGAGLVAGSYDLRYGNGTPVASVAKADNIAQVWSITHRAVSDPGTKIARWSVNGSLQNEASNVNACSAPTENLKVGNRPGGTVAGTYLSGLVGTLLIYNRELSLTERQTLEGYLAWKYGLQGQLPYNHPYAKSFPGYGSQATPTDSDALTYLAAVAAADGTGVEVGVANAVDDFVKGCKSDGIWSSIKASCVLAGARTLNGALVPLRGVAPTPYNFAAGDYNRETGLSGDPNLKSLRANRLGLDDPLNDHHMATFATDTKSVQSRFLMGSASADRIFHSGTTEHLVRSRDTVDYASGRAVTNGFVGTSRNNASNYAFRSGGVTDTAALASNASAFNLNADIFIFGTSTSGGYTGRLLYYSIGESLDLAALDNRVSRLIVGNEFALNTGLSPVGYHIEALDWANRVYANGGTVSKATMAAVSAFCNAIDAAGIRDRFYRLNLFCGNSDASLAAVRTPLYRGQSRTGTQYGNALDTNNNFVQGDYAETGASGGLLGNGTSKYLNTGLAPDALPSAATGHLAAWTRGGSVGGTRRVIGTDATVAANRFTLDRRLTGGGGDLIQWGSLAGGPGTDDATAGLFSGSRVSATDLRFYKDGTQSGSTQTGSATVTAHSNPWFVLAANLNGSPGNYYEHRLAAYSIGDGMTDAQMLSYYNALNTFMGALSRT